MFNFSPSIISNHSSLCNKLNTTLTKLRASPTPSVNENYIRMWHEWKRTYNMDHLESDSNDARYFIFKENMIKIDQHNANPLKTYTMAPNKFSHMTHQEFKYKMLKPYVHDANVPRQSTLLINTAAPKTMDWRSNGAVTPVKDQGQCGSCYSFSATGSLEGAHYQATNELLSLSEQQVVDCSASYGDTGCDGGLMTNVFEYVIKNGGICLESDYPYMARVGTCNTTCNKVAQISSYVALDKNETLLQNAVGTVGPVSIAVDASGDGWMHYSTGVYTAPCGQDLDHGVLVVGYGTDSVSNKDYWVVKNSWGPSWGENGYIRLVRGINQCGISNMASYPVV
jgi:cathepsin L